MRCHGETVITDIAMKILGVYFDAGLSWTTQIKNTINKITRLTSGLRFLQRRLSKIIPKSNSRPVLWTFILRLSSRQPYQSSGHKEIKFCPLQAVKNCGK